MGYREFVFILLVVDYSFATPIAARGDEQLKSRVLEEAPREWKRFRKRAQNHSRVAIGKRIEAGVEKMTGKGISQSRGPFKLAIGEDFSTVEPASSPPAMRVSVIGINDQYYFQLQAEKREGPFKLVKLQKIAREEFGKEMPRDIFISSWATENDFLIVEVEALPEIFAKPYFQLRSAEYLAEGDHRYIRCEIGYEHKQSDQTIPMGKAWMPYSEFTLDLDPDNYYQIRRVTAELTEGGETYTCTNEISQGQGAGVPTYVLEKRTVKKATGELIYTERSEIVERSFTAPPKANFYLTAFGLPEPPGFKKPGIPIFVWLGSAGLILIIAALFWNRYRKTAG